MKLVCEFHLDWNKSSKTTQTWHNEIVFRLKIRTSTINLAGVWDWRQTGLSKGFFDYPETREHTEYSHTGVLISQT
jgi:hypothetical protein